MPHDANTNPLVHLDEAQIKELIRRYYARDEPVAALLAAYEINCRANELYRHFPLQLLEDPECPQCGGVLAEHPRARHASTWQNRQIRCTACGHWTSGQIRCDCESCMLQRACDAIARQKSIRESISKSTAAPFKHDLPLRVAADLTLWEAISLLCLVRTGGWYSETVIEQLAGSPIPLTPEDALTQDLIDTLQAGRLAYADPSTPDSAFVVWDDKVIGSKTDRLRWRIGADNPVELVSEIELVARQGNWPSHWRADLAPICQQLALAECRQFARYCLRQRSMGEPGETALRNLIDNLLQDYSVAQIYRVLWNGARSAADYMVRKEVHRQHAANFFIGACQRWADRARAEGWEVKPFGRNFELPRTQLSYVLYDVFLRCGDAGFTDPLDTLGPFIQFHSGPTLNR